MALIRSSVLSSSLLLVAATFAVNSLYAQNAHPANSGYQDGNESKGVNSVTASKQVAQQRSKMSVQEALKQAPEYVSQPGRQQSLQQISPKVILGVAPEDIDSVFQQINQEVLANSAADENLAEASKTIGHRLTGSENGKKAEQFTFDLFKSYGYNNVKFQPFEVESWSRG
ncbi:MAG: hypothetical protein EOO04_28900, partial [Chitinophagaceae bacterium]